MFLGLHPWDLFLIPKCALVYTAFDVYYTNYGEYKEGCMMQVKKKIHKLWNVGGNHI